MFAISSSSSTSSASPSPTKSAADFSTKISPPNLTKNDHDGTTVVEMQKMMAKKRVSLADYKSLRRVSSTSSNPASTPSTPVLMEVTTATPSITTATPTMTTTSSSNVTSLPPVSTKTTIPVKTSSDLSTLKRSDSQQRDPEREQQVSEEPGTPTQDEQQPTMQSSLSTSSASSSTTTITSSSKPVGNLTSTLPPSLNTLPLFEKLDKLELAQQEIKRKASQNSYMSLESNNSTAAPSTGPTLQHSTSVVLGNSRSPVFEPKREDLTSRLQKEFGLLVDTDTNSDSGDQINNPDDVGCDGEGVGGDATPEEDSPPPPPPSGSSGSTRFLPSQIPSYTTPTTGYPASTAASVAQQPPVPHVHHYSSSGVSRAKYPPPP